MEKLHCSIFIEAPVQKVWDTMLEDATYREWTQVFAEGSRYSGDWSEGSRMTFHDGSPEQMGMVAMVRENRLHSFISLEHVGMIKNGVEVTTSEEVKKWTPAFENYTFREKEGGTEVEIDMDISEEHREMFNDLWPKALQKLKELGEKQ